MARAVVVRVGNIGKQKATWAHYLDIQKNGISVRPVKRRSRHCAAAGGLAVSTYYFSISLNSLMVSIKPINSATKITMAGISKLSNIIAFCSASVRTA
jgi:hypothetical protein